eukprot:TRINITY_DN3674_c0_g1_i1.p1 TRINITY_DN3674_c0_g1~~TRINITY_DN3674_c0_g1_i1.p1  ORF type:complete len:203 (-),score=28.05 TRINITY_DN3674_c0_g1_i1:44-652(-)
MEDNLRLKNVTKETLLEQSKQTLSDIANYRHIALQKSWVKLKMVEAILAWKGTDDDALPDNYPLSNIGQASLHRMQKTVLLKICSLRDIPIKKSMNIQQIVAEILKWKRSASSYNSTNIKKPKQRRSLKRKAGARNKRENKKRKIRTDLANNYELNGIGKATLLGFTKAKLLEICEKREIKVAKSSNKPAIVTKILAWKQTV